PLGHQAPVALDRESFMTEQTDPAIPAQNLPPHPVRVASLQLGTKGSLIALPVATRAVIIEEFIHRRELGVVLVGNAKSLTQQKSQVVLLGVAGELRGVTKSYVDDCLHASFLQAMNQVA